MIATVPTFVPSRVRRHAGIAATVLVHAVLILLWQMTREPATIMADPPRTTIQWIRLPAPTVPAPRREEAHPHPARPHQTPGPAALFVPAPNAPAPASPPPPAATDNPAAQAPVPAAEPTGATLLEQARRAAGGIDRALRKENNPYIVAPLDSPQIRMRKGIAAAAHMEPGMDELVNNTGDGARRTRVVTGGSTYCMTERSPATSIDMIEKHGKWRQTNCPGHESTANGQEWRTARD